MNARTLLCCSATWLMEIAIFLDTSTFLTDGCIKLVYNCVNQYMFMSHTLLKRLYIKLTCSCLSLTTARSASCAIAHVSVHNTASTLKKLSYPLSFAGKAGWGAGLGGADRSDSQQQAWCDGHAACPRADHLDWLPQLHWHEGRAVSPYRSRFNSFLSIAALPQGQT